MVKRNKKLHAVLSDVHVPYHDMAAIDKALDRVDEEKAGKVILLGDIADFEAVSRFSRKLDKRAAFYNEIEMVRGMLAYFKKRLKGCEIHFFAGNHESVGMLTEILCDSGWKYAKDVTMNDKVAQFSLETKKISCDFPVKVSNSKASEYAIVENNRKYEEVTMNHALIVDGKRQLVEDLPCDLSGERFTYSLPSQGKGVSHSNDMIQLLTWVITDGTIVDHSKYIPKSKKIRVQFKLSKQRKINMLRELLDRMGVPYTFKVCKKTGVNKLQPYYIRIYSDWARKIHSIVGKEKNIPSNFLGMNKEQVDAFFFTLLHTDGSKHFNQNRFSTINKQNADIVQLIAVLNGRSCVIKRGEALSGFIGSTVKTLYKVRIDLADLNHLRTRAKVKRVKEITKVVSITTNEDTLITRMHGKVNFTGNSRLSKYVTRNCPELSGIPALALREILEVPKDWGFYGYNLNAVNIDGINYVHGRRFSGNICMGNLSRYMGSIVQGHSHKASSAYLRLPSGKRIGAVECGCLCDLKPSYTSDVTWTHAMAFCEDGLPYLEVL